MPNAKDVQLMFNKIANSYDLANHILSFGLDIYWRKVLAKKISRDRPKSIVDLATGTGDLVCAIKRHLKTPAKITGIDFSKELLRIAKNKFKSPEIEFIEGDCTRLPLENMSVDCATLAFGLRNFEDRAQGLREAFRVLKPAGKLYILEFSQINSFKFLYKVYLKYILPLLAFLITRNKSAYMYLGTSIEAFPNKENLKQEILKVGFAKVEVQALTCSIVAIHECIKL